MFSNLFDFRPNFSMSSNTDLEIKGNLHDCRLAELLVEVLQTKLNGSLRASSAMRKIVVYLDAGEVVFAVSNVRSSRFFELLLRADKISKEQLTAIPDFTNDLALRKHLLEKNVFSKTEIDRLFSGQIGEILTDAFSWRSGEWIFSPLVRIKGDIRFEVDINSLLLEHARNIPVEDSARSLRDTRETFAVKSAMPAHIDMQPEEAFVFSRFENSSLTVEKIKFLSGLSEAATLRILYILWLGGFITRRNWNSPFSERQVSHILSVNLSLKKEETPSPKISEVKIGRSAAVAEKTESPASAEEIPAEEAEITLEEYLERTENSANYYLFFAVAPDASAAEIKHGYFTLARRFHPDLFHKEVDAEKHRQIQNAFSKIAHAYETLKNENTRTVYDYKMRRELAEMELTKTEKTTASGAGETDYAQKQTEQAKTDFEHGFNLLLDENYEDAIPFLARAAHLAKDNARYRAYYGKALAEDGRQNHKAEAELQAAIKIDPSSHDIRLMLAEFFVQMQMLKRAEGELNRLLAIFPGNREARALLDSLPKR